MKSSVAVKAMLIYQSFRFPVIWTMTMLLSKKNYVLQFSLINCETVAVKSFGHFLLVNTRNLENNPINSDVSF